MYDFHYNAMQEKYTHDTCKLLFTDTDSLCYHVKTDDIYADMEIMKDKFDFSGYPEDHPLYNKDNCAVIGLMKDESNGIPITEFVGLKPKMYGYKTDDKEDIKAKGVKKCVVKNELYFDDFKNVLNLVQEKWDHQKDTTYNTVIQAPTLCY